MASDIPKQYLNIAGKTILEHTLSIFLNSPKIHKVVVAIRSDDSFWPNTAIASEFSEKLVTVTGGSERADSVLNCLNYIKSLGDNKSDWVLVHDAARPCLQSYELHRMMDSLQIDDVGGLMALPASDTIKYAKAFVSDVNDQSSQNTAFASVETTLDRKRVWLAQTPQMFRLEVLHNNIAKALALGLPITDEASAMEMAGFNVKLYPGRSDNLKITVAEDLRVATAILSQS
ncbi:2-C-methyl-D-erythritol 4-phosphate cytidylyltransferase [Sessilibacter sp. MAH1]